MLGAGGMSAVYTAQDMLVDRLVALKILNARADSTHAERFRREVVVGQKGHPNLVTTYDAGVWEGRFFIAMELVKGRTLRRAIVSDGPLSQPGIDRLVEDLLSGLAHLHARGITHRDVKTSNVMITDDGTAKLADFGLARIPEDHTVTSLHEEVGTPAYMAPEQILGERVGPPADLYALGVLLFEATTGERPFAADSQAAMLHQHLKTSPDFTVLKTASSRLRNLILRLLEKNPTRRYPDAQDCLAAWRRGRIRKPLPRRLLAMGAAGLLVAGAVVGGVLVSAEAVRTSQEGPELRGISRWGTTAWTKNFPGGTEVVPAPKSRTTPPGFLVAYQTDSSDPLSSHIVLLDRVGKTIFNLQTASDPTLLRDHGFSGSLVRYRLLPPADVDGDGDPDLLAILYGAPWYFSTVVKLHPEASPVGIEPILFNPGIIEWARFTDADHDGEGEWYVAAMNNELLHTACVYRVDGSMHTWAPPRLGAEPAFPNMRWFNAISRQGGNTFRSVTLGDGGGVGIVMQNGETMDFDAWGNAADEIDAGDDPIQVSAERLAGYEQLSAIHLLLLDHDVNGARRLLNDLDPKSLAGDEIAEAFRLFLEGRAALYSGDYDGAVDFASQSFAAAPVSNDALMLAVTARILDHRLDEVDQLIAPNSRLTMGSPADFQEVRGMLAWLQGDDDEAWALFEHRGKLPLGLGAQHRARLLIGQNRFEAAQTALEEASSAFSRERLDLLGAIALGRLGKTEDALRILAAELERHPWLRPETGVVAQWLACRGGTGTAPNLQRSVEAAKARASWDLYAFLDLPLLLSTAADAALLLGEPGLAAGYLDQAERAHPGLPLVSEVRRRATAIRKP